MSRRGLCSSWACKERGVSGLTIRSSRARFAASALAGYDLTIANAAQRPGLAQALAMHKQIAIAILLASLSACATPGSPLSGHYFWGHEVETFQPCGSTQTFWVVGDTDLLQPLRDQVARTQQIAGKPYEPLYVQVTAMQEAKATDGFAADYNGVYRFTHVHRANAVSPASCKAHG